jgi:4-diphosphocytidyl-2-C-methyl-D-erythritol kinase
VPFFLHGGLCAGLGRGDEITELPDLSRFDVVVAVPEVGVPTAAAFDRWARRLTSYPPEGTVDALAADPRGLCDFREMANGFEETVVDGWPEVGEGLRILRSHDPVHASLSGSGSASFAVFEHRAAARRAAADLPGHWFVHVGSSVPRERARLAVEVLSDGGGC